MGQAADYQKYEQIVGAVQGEDPTQPPGNHDYHTAAGSPPYSTRTSPSQLPHPERLVSSTPSTSADGGCTASTARSPARRPRLRPRGLRNDLATAGAGEAQDGLPASPAVLMRPDAWILDHSPCPVGRPARAPARTSWWPDTTTTTSGTRGWAPTGVAANDGHGVVRGRHRGRGPHQRHRHRDRRACALAQFHQGSQLGVLKLTLGTTSFSWAFVATDDSVLDSGTQPTSTASARRRTLLRVVGAGPDRSITLPSTVSLAGVVSDDGLPSPPGTGDSTWSRVSGPGTVTFTDASSPTTTASFSVAGSYVLQLSATDGALTTSDQVAVTVAPAGGVVRRPRWTCRYVRVLMMPRRTSAAGLSA